nr:hypothetical protein [Tanacetum cinerariifolium]
RKPDFKYKKVFLQRKLILTSRLSTILGLELFLQDIQSFELKEKDSVCISKPDFKYKKVFLQRKLILTSRLSTILGLELFLQDIQSFELKEKDSVCIKHLSDTYVVTVKMEILLEPSSNKLLVEHLSDTYVVTVKMEILLEPSSNKLLAKNKLEKDKIGTKPDQIKKKKGKRGEARKSQEQS